MALESEVESESELLDESDEGLAGEVGQDSEDLVSSVACNNGDCDDAKFCAFIYRIRQMRKYDVRSRKYENLLFETSPT